MLEPSPADADKDDDSTLRIFLSTYCLGRFLARPLGCAIFGAATWWRHFWHDRLVASFLALPLGGAIFATFWSAANFSTATIFWLVYRKFDVAL